MTHEHDPGGQPSAPRSTPLRRRGGPGLLLLGLGLVALVGVPWYLGGRDREQRRKKPGTATQRARALFVWDGELAFSPERTTELLVFAAGKGVDRLFLECSPLGYGRPGAAAAYADLVALAHSAGIGVVATAGHPWWTVSDEAHLPDQPTGWSEGWNFFAAVAASGVPFDGVLDDSEPYLAAPDDWNARTQERAQDYLDYLRGLRARIGGLTFHATIPFWYDEAAAYELTLDGSPTPQPLNRYVAQVVDVAVVMDYRDFASGTDGLVEHALGELGTGPAILAVETNWLGDDPISDKTSFWEEGERVLENELDAVSAAFAGEAHLLGFAIHDEAAYRLLGP